MRTDHPERTEQEVKQVRGARVLDVVLEVPLQKHTVSEYSSRFYSDHLRVTWSYQLVEGVFELLQTVHELVLSRGFGAQSQDALWWTTGPQQLGTFT